MQASYKKYVLDFKRPAGTSRGRMTQKETWFLLLETDGKWGIGECGIFRGLSSDDVPRYEEKLRWTCQNIHLGKDALWTALTEFPSIQFGLEQAFISLASEDPFELFPSHFTQKESPIPINGLIWMGDIGFMQEQIQQKLEAGFDCIKMKIGALDFDQELEVLASIRKQYSKEKVTLRVDANGAFAPQEAPDKLQALSEYELHSIEQPIRQGNHREMAQLCANTPIPIALDEELIGVIDVTKKVELLQTIRPQYIIVKPSLIGGFRGSEEWIRLCEQYGIGWWITSALESNIGLNAIAQWTHTLQNALPQGLGTGDLFTNNFDSPLAVENGKLFYKKTNEWKINLIQNLCT
ncbi:o-succinylbenzoate synthase [Spongiimicrobium sp. 2-473A-2-J]|uniref:o-succinylbenzoate synthase n=1 Tax=Eudoraea algarum TaxID=3417568 RepID=UPI003D36913B